MCLCVFTIDISVCIYTQTFFFEKTVVSAVGPTTGLARYGHRCEGGPDVVGSQLPPERWTIVSTGVKTHSVNLAERRGGRAGGSQRWKLLLLFAELTEHQTAL